MHGEQPKLDSGAAETIFHAALAFKATERSAYLAGACGDNDELRRRVAALLQAHEETAGFLPEQPQGPPTAVVSSPEGPGDRIGRYKLLQRIGEGGCGVVYMGGIL